MYIIHITPRCRRPARGQIFLKALTVKGDSFSFTLPSRYFRQHAAPNPRMIYASDARTQEKVTGICLVLPDHTDVLVTTAIWQVFVPDEMPFDVQHVVQWILPSPLAPLMSDDTRLWPPAPGTPTLSAGDWPVMDTDQSTLQRVRRRSFTIIDNRNRKGYITRRFQCFPLAPLPADGKYESLPDLVIHPEQETIKCKEKLYSQPL
ncbi:TPA: conjugal transfer protein TraV [Escherichia coli]